MIGNGGDANGLFKGPIIGEPGAGDKIGKIGKTPRIGEGALGGVFDMINVMNKYVSPKIFILNELKSLEFILETK